jgi:Flp pilus assembly protein TadG
MRLSATSTSNRPRIEQRRAGVAAAELAILAPFLVTVVLGTFELGRGVMVKDILTDAARKGCRTGVTATGTYQGLINDVQNILTDNSITAADATITIQIASYTGTGTTPSWGAFTTVSGASSYTPKTLDKVSVKVAIPVTDALWLAPVFMSSASLESETLIMVKQG